MKKIAFIMLFGLLIALSLSVAGCSGGGNSGTPANASEVPNQVASAQVPVTEETTITVSDPNSPIVGTKVVIPKNAAIDPINVVIGYEDNLPAPLNANALSMGAVQVSKVIIPHVTGGGPSTFNHLIEITIPYDKTKAKGLPPVVVYWDETNKIYRPVAVVKVDRDKGLVTFKAPHFSRFMAIIVGILGTSMPNVDTGFRMGVDSILHQNFGSYEYGGHCMAFASIASHYFSMKKSKKLYAFAQDGVLEQPLDDELVRSALRYTYALLASKWEDVKSQVLIPSKTDTGLLVLEAMIITGQPVHFGIGSSSQDFGHSVVVYGYDSANARFRIYDNSLPEDEVTFDWNIRTGFGSYSRAGDYPNFSTDNVGYFSDDTFGESAQFEKIISDWESGALKDYFANLSVKDDKGVAQNLSFNSDVKIAIPSTNTVTLTGHFNSPTGNTNTINYLRVMQNGKQLSVTGTAIPASGDFSFNVDGNISTDTEIVLMVSGHQRNLFKGFAAYGKFTIAPAPPLPPAAPIPSNPTGFTVTPASSSQINLSWNASTGAVNAYNVYRNIGAYHWNEGYLKSVTTTSTSDTGLSLSTNYCYTVTAYNDAGESGPLGPICTTTSTSPPAVISGTWNETYSQTNGTAGYYFYGMLLTLTQSGNNVTGTWVEAGVEARIGCAPYHPSGTASGTINGNIVNLTLSQTSEECKGTFYLSGTVTGNTMSLLGAGTACNCRDGCYYPGVNVILSHI